MAETTIPNKTCSKCGYTGSATKFRNNRSVCRNCTNARLRAYSSQPKRKQWLADYNKRPSSIAARKIRCSKNHDALRAKVIAILGGKCVRCGFDDPRALQVDHLNGKGSIERRTKGTRGSDGVYRRIVAGHTEDYQLLCANCNWIKRIENKEQ